MSFLRRCLPSLTRQYSSLSTPPSASPSAKLPLLYEPPEGTAAATLQLYSWGRGSSGQLGGGVDEIRMYPVPVAELQLPRPFSLSPTPGKLRHFPSSDSSASAHDVSIEVGVSCGLFHSSLLVGGDLWVWGKGDGGRLGLGHENPVFEPTLNPNLDSVSCIALGGLHSVALTSAGQLFSWGYGGFGALGHSVFTRELLPRLVEGPWDDEIRHVATTGTHTAAVTKSGALYTWGREEGDGRLGLGPGRGPDQTGGLSVPSHVKALSVPVASVSCGGFFTMALTEEGQVWNWGANANYELGRGNKLGGWQPKVPPSLEDVRITQIACGGYHSLALTDDCKVLSWGHGGHGQLGHCAIRSEKEPKVVETLANERVVSIACGGSTSAAITDKGKLYMWGNGKDSQLGIPAVAEVQPCPKEVKFLNDEDGPDAHNVLSVAIGASHTLCLVSKTAP